MFAMRQCANLVILPWLVLASHSPATDKHESFNLDPRYGVALSHLFYAPLTIPIALRFINDVMRFEAPKLCDVIGYRNFTKLNDSSNLFDIVCLKNGSNRPVALIGILPVRFESAVPELTQYEVTKAYSQQLYGLDYKQRIHQYKNLIPIKLILLSQFDECPIDRPLKHARMLDTWSHENFYTGFGITSLYLEKCKERVRRDSDVIKNDLDKWCHFFLFSASYRVGEVPTWVKGDGVMELAYWALNSRTYTEPELKLHNESVEMAEKDFAAYREGVKEGTWPKPKKIK